MKQRAARNCWSGIKRQDWSPNRMANHYCFCLSKPACKPARCFNGLFYCHSHHSTATCQYTTAFTSFICTTRNAKTPSRTTPMPVFTRVTLFKFHAHAPTRMGLPRELPGDRNETHLSKGICNLINKAAWLILISKWVLRKSI